MAGAGFVIGNAGFFQEVVADGVAPDDRVARLIFQASENVIEAWRVYVPLQRLPLIDELDYFGSAFVVGIVNVLDDGFVRMKLIGVRNVMEEKEKFVGRCCEGLIDFRDRRTVLADETGAGRDGAVHADSLFVGAMPLAPAIFF